MGPLSVSGDVGVSSAQIGGTGRSAERVGGEAIGKLYSLPRQSVQMRCANNSTGGETRTVELRRDHIKTNEDERMQLFHILCKRERAEPVFFIYKALFFSA